MDTNKNRAPFAYISTPDDLEPAVTSLLTRDENDSMDESGLLNNLRQFSSAIEGKTPIINSDLGFSMLLRLVAGCPVSSDHIVSKWVQISVGILAKADNIQNENPSLSMDYWRPVLEVIDRACVDIEDSEFQVGLVNLIYLFLKLELEGTEHIITSHGEVIRALSSYIIRPTHRHFATSKNNFGKLFDVTLRLWATEEGLKQPRLSQAVASLVWPVHEQFTDGLYYYLLSSISSVLDSRPRDPDNNNLHNYMEGSLELMTRAGLVSSVFQLLDNATLSDNMIMRCFEILWFLSSITIGRLEIIRVISCSDNTYLESFYTAIARTASNATAESHLIPALSIIYNLLVNARYVLVNARYFQRVHSAEGPGFHHSRNTDFQDFDHEGVRTLQKQIKAASDEIASDEEYALAAENYQY